MTYVSPVPRSTTSTARVRGLLSCRRFFDNTRIFGAGSDGQNHMTNGYPLQGAAPTSHSGLITLESRTRISGIAILFP